MDGLAVHEYCFAMAICFKKRVAVYCSAERESQRGRTIGSLILNLFVNSNWLCVGSVQSVLHRCIEQDKPKIWLLWKLKRSSLMLPFDGSPWQVGTRQRSM